jgi:proteic killer suppression protein
MAASAGQNASERSDAAHARFPRTTVIGMAAHTLKDLAALRGNRFEALKGDRQGQYSIRINDQWRICFEWSEKSPGPTNVEIVDYH